MGYSGTTELPAAVGGAVGGCRCEHQRQLNVAARYRGRFRGYPNQNNSGNGRFPTRPIQMRDAVVVGRVATSTPALRYRWSALRNDVPRLLELYSRSALAESSRASGEAWEISSPAAAAQSPTLCGHALCKARLCSVYLHENQVRGGSMRLSDILRVKRSNRSRCALYLRSLATVGCPVAKSLFSRASRKISRTRRAEHSGNAGGFLALGSRRLLSRGPLWRMCQCGAKRNHP